MSSEKYLMTFRLESAEEREALTGWLKQNLRSPNSFETSGADVVLTSPTRDEAHKCAVWISNRNPVRKMKYTIKGLRDEKLVYISFSKTRKIHM